MLKPFVVRLGKLESVIGKGIFSIENLGENIIAKIEASQPPTQIGFKKTNDRGSQYVDIRQGIDSNNKPCWFASWSYIAEDKDATYKTEIKYISHGDLNSQGNSDLIEIGREDLEYF